LNGTLMLHVTLIHLWCHHCHGVSACALVLLSLFS
jgi:hypothetical protein